MLIQQTPTEIIIRIPSGVEVEGLQRLIDFLKFRELVSKSKATQEQVDELASQINKNWWEKNKDKLLP
ncbi:hypothetical protein [Thermoflexibacter ruber]|uniref:Uncharacterized protein n=1 Tax=Thermoflexibacter ruber TaxID=1003 RepID=A0A1I2IRU2_9BACT|nr:hypothetical protein [Thermoflexibacter ruber]SFF43536.1 hypothetical protein SAMN04488541_10348 [Thermoflexibacter ruber]